MNHQRAKWRTSSLLIVRVNSSSLSIFLLNWTRNSTSTSLPPYIPHMPAQQPHSCLGMPVILLQAHIPSSGRWDLAPSYGLSEEQGERNGPRALACCTGDRRLASLKVKPILECICGEKPQQAFGSCAEVWGRWLWGRHVCAPRPSLNLSSLSCVHLAS